MNNSPENSDPHLGSIVNNNHSNNNNNSLNGNISISISGDEQPTTTNTRTNNSGSPHSSNRNILENNYRSRNNINSILNFYSSDLIFDSNTFKQVKRLYCGMLIVAMAYSITMVIMMVVVYKSIPDSRYPLSKEAYNIANAVSKPHRTINPLTNNADILSGSNLISIQEQSATSFYQRFHDGEHSTRTHLDQVIAINFLTSILYLMAFYAAQKEFYNLTLAFTTTLAVSIIISLVKILTEGSHFPNNLMGLLLRLSIVLVALIYSVQIRRKQIFISNAHSFWLNNPMLNRSSTSTVQLITEILSSTAGSDSNKTDEHMIREYQDQPPDYEEALRCIPVPYIQPIPSGISSTPVLQQSINPSTEDLVEPPSFEQFINERK